jgi:hypothetical protein
MAPLLFRAGSIRILSTPVPPLDGKLISGGSPSPEGLEAPTSRSFLLRLQDPRVRVEWTRVTLCINTQVAWVPRGSRGDLRPMVASLVG